MQERVECVNGPYGIILTEMVTDLEHYGSHSLIINSSHNNKEFDEGQ